MIKPYRVSKLIDERELVPQAIIQAAIPDLARRYRWRLEEGHDDFDDYVGTAFVLETPTVSERALPFAIMHYKGHPDATSTIYLPFEVQNVPLITKLISTITNELDISEKIVWQRKDEEKALRA